ncbi:putative bifunctional diguanylate cyclase/phosphodiesterase [Salinisphaera hydrothermalis]|uniref:putative bifunctional diguanylate cyclase/phosphodiesterase n=1 Tax=Salinisphaera hydrothermalis TaxID=563188 RepID=UPI0018DC9C42|nr:bifunctional diguanylate cyclase/phosphodiesterase [Salinisphaera hydrothermalis]
MSDTSLAAVSQLVRSAASALDCRCAVFYRLDAEILYPVHSEGIASADAYAMPEESWLAADRGIDAIRVYHDLDSAGAMVPPVATPDRRFPRFMTLAPVICDQGRRLGLLLLADTSPQARLSAAKLYALSVHAVQLALHYQERSVQEQRPPYGWQQPDRLRLLESVVENAKDAVLITEAEPIEPPGPRIVYCNASFTRTTGYSEAEVLGRTPRILQNDNTSRAALDRLRDALENWQAIEIELLNQRKDGGEFWVELSIVPVADDSGRYTHWISVQRDISERKQAEAIADQARIAEAENAALEAKLHERQRIEQSLAYAASHDDLTHLRNRAYVMERVQSLVLRDQLDTGDASLLFLDMDRFKLVNDSLGHRAGDLLLKQMARRLEACVRAEDTLARVGGDEFVVLIENDPARQAPIDVAERIIEAFDQPFRISEQDIYSSASIGIVHIDAHYSSPEQVVRDADVAMYAAKQLGKGTYSLFTESMQRAAVETLSLQNDLRQALVSRQFSLAYQPIYALGKKGCFGVEALARWHHPGRGWVAPNVFIPMAEEIDVIRELGHWVMSQACRQMRSWGAAAADLKLFVNVSAREIRDHRFLDQVDQALAESGLAPSRLQLEITENIFIQDPEHVARVLEALRSRGIRVVLDDFGTGYSSLSYLDRYAIDALKIDREFVTRMASVRRTRAIVDSILSLGTTLGVDIVAEGIETSDELEMLQRLGCPFGQGFLLAPPMSAEDFAEQLAVE